MEQIEAVEKIEKIEKKERVRPRFPNNDERVNYHYELRKERKRIKKLRALFESIKRSNKNETRLEFGKEFRTMMDEFNELITE